MQMHAYACRHRQRDRCMHTETNTDTDRQTHRVKWLTVTPCSDSILCLLSVVLSPPNAAALQYSSSYFVSTLWLQFCYCYESWYKYLICRLSDMHSQMGHNPQTENHCRRQFSASLSPSPQQFRLPYQHIWHFHGLHHSPDVLTKIISKLCL